jgi:hypothetical protein
MVRKPDKPQISVTPDTGVHLSAFTPVRCLIVIVAAVAFAFESTRTPIALAAAVVVMVLIDIADSNLRTKSSVSAQMGAIFEQHLAKLYLASGSSDQESLAKEILGLHQRLSAVEVSSNSDKEPIPASFLLTNALAEGCKAKLDA